MGVNAPARMIPSLENFAAQSTGGEDYPQIWLPFDVVNKPDIHVWAWLIVAVLAGGMIYFLFRQYWQRRHIPSEYWRKFQGICEEKHLTADQARALADVLRKLDVDALNTAVESEVYFSHFVQPLLERSRGNALAELIKEKLFSEPLPGEEGASHLDKLLPHTPIRLRFSGFPGHFRGTVIQVDREGFTVTFPTYGSSDMVLQRYDDVEAAFESGESLYIFGSEVLAGSGGSLCTCRIALPKTMTEIHRRSGGRVAMNQAIKFSHVPAWDIASDVIDLPEVDRKLREAQPGILREIGLGGCSIRLQTRQDFAKGDLVRFTLPAPDGPEPLEFLAGVVGTSYLQHSHNLHLEFLGLDDDARHLLALLIERKKREPEESGADEDAPANAAGAPVRR